MTRRDPRPFLEQDGLLVQEDLRASHGIELRSDTRRHAHEVLVFRKLVDGLLLPLLLVGHGCCVARETQRACGGRATAPLPMPMTALTRAR